MKEQQISGLCMFYRTSLLWILTTLSSVILGSSLCFILATYNHPELTSLAWGRTAEELDEATVHTLQSPGTGIETVGLGSVVWMTRWYDLGLSSADSAMEMEQTPERHSVTL